MKNNKLTLMAVGLLFILLTLAITYPLVTDLNGSLAGDGGDASIFAWDMWWFNYSFIKLHKNPFHCNYILNPLGTSLIFHTLVPLYGAISIPLQIFASASLCYNIFFLLTFIITGWGVFILCKALGLRTEAAIFAAIAFTYSPVRMARALGHLNLLSTQWLPLFLFFLLIIKRNIIVKKEKLRFIIGASLIAAASIYTSYQLTVILLLMSAFWVFIPVFRVSDKQFNDGEQITSIQNYQISTRKIYWKTTIEFGFILLITLVLVSPLIVLSINELLKEGGNFLIHGSKERYVTDMLYYFIPYHQSFLFGFLVHKLPEALWKGTEKVISTGLVVFLLAMFSCFSKKMRKQFPWIKLLFLMFSFFFVLSLGSFLTINGYKIPIPLPFILFRKIPLINGLNIPNRFAIAASFILVLLASNTVHYLFSKPGISKAKRLMYFLLFPLLLSELFVYPFPKQKILYFNFPANIVKSPILQIPFGLDDSYELIGNNISHFYMLNQTIWNMKMTSGHVSRLPLKKIFYFESNPAYKLLATLQKGEKVEKYTFREQMVLLQSLKSVSQIRTIILHKDYLPIEAYRRIKALLRLTFPKASVTVANNKWILSLPYEKWKKKTIDCKSPAITPFLNGYYYFNKKDNWIQFWDALTILIPVQQKRELSLTFSLKALFKRNCIVSLSAKINGNEIGIFQLSSQWKDFTITIPASFIHEGSNQFKFRVYRKVFLFHKQGLLSREIKLFSAGFNYNNSGGISKIIIDGKNYSTDERGLNIVTLSKDANKILWSHNYDTCGSSFDVSKLIEDIKNMSNGTIILATVKDDAVSNVNKKLLNAIAALNSSKFEKLEFRQAYCMIGIKGGNKPAIEASDESFAIITNLAASVLLSKLEIQKKILKKQKLIVSQNF